MTVDGIVRVRHLPVRWTGLKSCGGTESAIAKGKSAIDTPATNLDPGAVEFMQEQVLAVPENDEDTLSNLAGDNDDLFDDL